MSVRRGPRTTSERLRRLLVILPWLMERGEVPVAEVCDRFGVTEAELVKDLELVAMCGLPPYTDELVDLWIDEGMVNIGVPRLFTRPLRLTAPEGFALLAATSTAMQLPGADREGPLARALAKLAELLGPGAMVIDAPAPALADVLAAAVERNERVQVDYRSAFAESTTAREITPRRVFVDRGHWYVIADDHRSGEVRTFRIDRIAEATPTGVFDQPRDVPVPATDEWFEHTDLPAATLRLGPRAAWVIERYPIRSAEPDGDGWLVELTVAHEAWLAELLLRLGPDAEVIAPDEWKSAGARAAHTLLRRYD